MEVVLIPDANKSPKRLYPSSRCPVENLHKNHSDMVNPGAFCGSRKEFLLGERQAYAIAVRNGYTQDAIAKIQRRYFKRYPIDLSHYEEPSAEWLAAVDDNAADPEPVEPDKDKLSETEYTAAMKKMEERKATLNFRKMQIKRWMASQYIKDQNAPPKDPASHNPYTSLLKKLIGSNIARPRQKSAANLWRKPEKDKIEAHLKGEIELGQRLNKPVSKDDYAKIRDRIARKLFAELDEDTRRHWLQEAMNDHRKALAEYNRQINADPSTEPEDRQLAIQGLVQFMQPVLDRVCAATGWKLSLLAGGPEPANAGRLSMISIHSGYTSGDVKMTFGRAERVAYKKHLVPMFGNFLRLCYSPEECRSRALPDEEHISVSSLDPDTDEATYHVIDGDEEPSPGDNISKAANTQVAHRVGDTAESSAVNGQTAPSRPTTANIAATPADPALPSTANVSASTPTVVPVRDIVVCTHPPASASPATTDHVLSESNTANQGDSVEDAPSPASSIDNPFPFEDTEEDTQMLYLENIHQPSPPASPPISCLPSPALSPHSIIPEEEGNTTQTPAEVSSVLELPAIAPASVLLPHRDMVPDGSVPPTGNVVSTKPSRKRKAKDAIEVPIIEPGSKRTRTKTMRALAAEEQQTKRQKADKSGVPKATTHGKENTSVARKHGAAVSKVTR